MSREEIETRLTELRKTHPNVFDAEYEVVNDTKTGSKLLEETKGEDAEELAHHAD
jgi:hypothetical protein